MLFKFYKVISVLFDVISFTEVWISGNIEYKCISMNETYHNKINVIDVREATVSYYQTAIELWIWRNAQKKSGGENLKLVHITWTHSAEKSLDNFILD